MTFAVSLQVECGPMQIARLYVEGLQGGAAQPSPRGVFRSNLSRSSSSQDDPIDLSPGASSQPRTDSRPFLKVKAAVGGQKKRDKVTSPTGLSNNYVFSQFTNEALGTGLTSGLDKQEEAGAKQLFEDLQVRRKPYQNQKRGARRLVEWGEGAR